MSKHARWCLIPTAAWILLFIPSGIIAQSSASNPETAVAPSKQTQSRPSTHALDPTLEEISKAEQEGRLLDAEKLLNTAIAEAERELPSRSGLGSLLNNLANVEYRLHHYKQAIAEEKRAVAADHALGAQATARVFLDLDELGAYARFSGDYTTFAQAAAQQLDLARRNPGPQDYYLLKALSAVVMAYHCERRDAEGRKVQAEEVRICEAQPEPRSTGCVSILAGYYRDTGHPGYAEELLSQRAAQTPDSSPGFRYGPYLPKISHLLALSRMYEADHSYNLAVATDRQMIALVVRTTKDPVQAVAFYDGLGRDLQLQGRDTEAEAAFKRSFDLRERATGRLRESFIESLGHTPLVSFYEKQGRLSDSEAVLKRALKDQQIALNPNDAALAYTLVQLADVELHEREYSDAEPLCERALKIQEADYGTDNPQLARTLSLYSAVERHLGKIGKADALAVRAAGLRQRAMPVSTPGP